METFRNQEYKYSLLDESNKQNTVPVKWSITWKVICSVMTAFLLLCAYVQLNDPDPWLWIPAYVIPAVLTVAVIVNRGVTAKLPWKIICDITVLLSILNAGYLFMVLTGILKENFVNPLEHEEGREFAGTLIVIIWLLAIRNVSLESFDASRRTLAIMLVVAGCLSMIPLIVWAACFHSWMHSRLGHCKDMFPGMLGDKHKEL